ncbi:universal stress protein [Ignicoccus hospitalis]|uniref:UspA domain protein n=1 Tax=Ignicoccus hospitalis (strain KIN4/I / DSM 18386 / JCM 14125) TaxID=453591 RepID=A8A9Z4_IGNH4|nr:universal stress protein [Ignicoccus hospitalis]ABU81746.1 UspA domain protein [Ignicoccus hospitalis KIN4/I]HIH90012.1 universal stress protein [Desulfurococcaceae archaeon]
MKKALVAVDGSEYSKYAVEYVSDLLNKDSWEVVVLHVIPSMEEFGIESVAPPSLVAQLLEELKENAKKIVEESAKVFQDKGFKVSTLIKEGHVGKTIVETAKELDADLIALGTRGLSGIKAIILGSVARYVANHAHCPVLVVRKKGA